MTVWFTADTHFGHANVIALCSRPFETVTEMDRALVDIWNSRVSPDDDVWHLGDFSHRNAKAASSYLARLHGRKRLIWGNHDSEEVRGLDVWASSQQMAEIAVDGTRLVLMHYAMKVWPGDRRGAIHLYGHSHARLLGDSQSCDVGVDVPFVGFGPVSLKEIQRHLTTLPPHADPELQGDER